MRLKVISNISFQKLHDSLSENIQKGTRRIARSAVKGAKERIDRGLSPALKKSTIELRKEKGTGGTKPLYETGSLYRSIKATDEGLEMNKYGWYHHNGFIAENVPIKFKNKKPIFLRKKKIRKQVPARPFIFPSEKEILEPTKKMLMDIRESLQHRTVIK
jgi:hypothetical protein